MSIDEAIDHYATERPIDGKVIGLWRPIKTAPTDCRRIEICQMTSDGKPLHTVECYSDAGGDNSNWTWPTHWRPASGK